VPSDVSVISRSLSVTRASAEEKNEQQALGASSWVWGSAVVGFCCVVGLLYTRFRSREKKMAAISLASSSLASYDGQSVEHSIGGAILVAMDDESSCDDNVRNPTDGALSMSFTGSEGVVQALETSGYHSGGSFTSSDAAFSSGSSGPIGRRGFDGRPVEVQLNPSREYTAEPVSHETTTITNSYQSTLTKSRMMEHTDVVENVSHKKQLKPHIYDALLSSMDSGHSNEQ
jgi:hypothetical protein